MEKARKKIRACLICVAALAVLFGAVWYFQEMKENTSVTEGTLVEAQENMPAADEVQICRIE